MGEATGVQRGNARRPGQRRLWLLLLFGLVIVTAGWLTAIVFLNVSDKRVEAAISLSLKVFSTVVGAGVALAGLILKLRAGREERKAYALPASNDRPGRTISGRRLSRAESLPQLVDKLNAELRERGVRHFVELTTATDVRDVTEPPFPRLEWLVHERTATIDVVRAEQIDLDEIGNRFRRAALLGDPGSGKSTLMAELARRRLRELEAAVEQGAPTGPVPLLVSLSYWNDPRQPALDFLRAQVEADFGPGNFFAYDFENQLASGKFLLLLDGLNEMPNRVTTGDVFRERASASADQGNLRASRRAAILDPREQSLRELAARSVSCSFILTCRSHEYFESPDWQVVRVQDMDPAQADEFIRAYAPRHMVTDLRREVKENPSLAALTANPFFLSSMVAAYDPGESFASRGEILDALLQRLLSREIGREDYREVVERTIRRAGVTAYRMLRRGLVGDRSPLPRAPEDEDWQNLLVRTGLLVERAGDHYFYHQIIQEHFSALALHRRAIRRSVKAMLPDTRWLEVLGLWRDLDSGLDKKLVRSLSSRNLPWRRPRAYSTPGYGVLSALSSPVMLMIVGSVVLDRLVGPVHSFTWPFGLLPISALWLVGVLLLVRLVWSTLLPHKRIIANAAYVLGRTGHSAAIPEILEAMKRVYDPERRKMATALAQFGREAVPHAAAGLFSRRWRIRMGSAQVLAAVAIREPDAVERVLVDASLIEDRRLARPLLEGLMRYHGRESLEAIERLLDRVSTGSPFLASVRIQPLQAAVAPPQGGGDAVDLGPRFYELLDLHPAPFVRGVLLQVLAALHLPGAADRLRAVVLDEEEPAQVRQTAVRSLALMDTVEAAAALMEVIAVVPGLRGVALAELVKLKNPEILDVLIPHKDGGNWQVRLAVADVVGRVGREASLHVLASMVDDPDEDVRAQVARSLGLSAAPGAVEQLARLARDQVPEVRAAAVDTLMKSYKKEAAGSLAAIAVDPRAKDRRRVLRVLAELDDPVAARALKRVTGDPDRHLRRAAERALNQLERRARAREAPAWRHPVARSRQALSAWLNWEGVRAIIHEERLAGTQSTMLFNKFLSRVNADAELAWKYSNMIRVIGWLVNLGLTLFILAIFALMRLSIGAAGFLREHWLIVIAFLAVAAVCRLTVVADLLDVSTAGWVANLALTSVAVLVVGLAVTGVIAYTWSIWFLLLLVLGTVGGVAYLRSCVRVARTVTRQMEVRQLLLSTAEASYEATPAAARV